MSDKAVCPFCKAELVEDKAGINEVARGYCECCRRTRGLPVNPAASRRPPQPCARCGHKVLVRALVRERSATEGHYSTTNLQPLAITFGCQRQPGFFSSDEVAGAPEPEKPFGVLEAYVCRACGHVEWYALAPEEIPIGAEFGTELVKV
jgi:hypothetical protein